MAQVTAEVTFDQVAGTAVLRLDLQGNTELEHELLVAMIGDGRKVMMVPDHRGDELFAVIGIQDRDMWDEAQHTLENRYRVRDGRPTIEEEEAQAAQRKANEKAAVEAADVKAKQAIADAEDKQEEADEKLAATVSAAVAKEMNKTINVAKRGSAPAAQPAPGPVMDELDAISKLPAPGTDQPK